MPKPNVRIRMYRPGLGDCFLVTFEDGGQESHILLDCGIFNGTPGEKDRITRIAQNIAEATKGRINAVVATHEHWDHVAGFVRAKEVFRNIRFDEAWVAWTEDPNQEIAQEHKKQSMHMAQGLAAAIARMESADALLDRECGRAIAQVAGFEGDIVLGAKFSVLSNEGMEFVAKRAGEFLEPGQLIERDWLPGVRAYVLGPPKDLAALKNMSGKHGESFESSKNGAAAAWMAALGVAEDESAAWRLRPFDEFLAWPENDRRMPDTPDADAEAVCGLLAEYDKESWRRIDNDWLLSASNLALQLDNAINNTSLVLAFEIEESKEVLLLVADAQVGNWKSWQSVSFSNGVTVQDLLARTVFYKVGHHGSGNATLRSGLAAMTNSDLVAAIPTDEKWAADEKGWEMPAPKLKPELTKKTKGRILRADPGRSPIRKPKSGISDEEWDVFKSRVTEVHDLYVDYRLP